MTPLKVGIIGAGGIAAKLHLPELRQLGDDVEITLVAGRRENRLKLLCDRSGARRWTRSYDEVISDPGIDAIVVATPHPQHVVWGIAALEAGKHLMMQKPLCADMNEAAAFVEAARKSDRTTFVLPHFTSVFHELRRRLDAGEIGKVTAARARTAHAGPEVYYREVAAIFGEDEGDLWFFNEQQASVGALFDMGVYAVAHLVALLGSVQRVAAFTSTLEKPTPLEDTAALLLQFRSGAIATAETGWCDGARTWEFSVHGARGKYSVPGAGGSPASWHVPADYESDHADIEIRPLEVRATVGSAHAHWLECIRHHQQPLLSHADAARHVTDTLLAGLESSRTGCAVDIQSRAEPHPVS